LQLSIMVDQIINVLVEHIDIRQQSVVLFLTFDKSILDLFNFADACSFHNGGERLINDLHILLITID
jgi:hypothetical protein